MKRTIVVAAVFLVAVVVLWSACSGRGDTTLTPTVTPESTSTTVPPENPVVTEAATVEAPWSQIVVMIKKCEVESVFRLHSRVVMVKSKTGQRYNTTEPAGVSAIDIVSGSPCEPRPKLAIE